jgi:hypothetical protein
VASLYPSKLGCYQIERPLPGHGQESFATTPLSIALAAREPALADHRLVNARRRMRCCRNRSNKRRRVGIAFERSDTNDPAIAMYYNFVRIHQTLKVTPAMAAGVTDRLWEMSNLVEMIEAFEAAQKRAA